MKKVKVNENCIGCGYCVSTCPKYFSFNDEGYSVAIDENIDENDIKEVSEIASGCPVDAIKIVDAEEKEEKAA